MIKKIIAAALAALTFFSLTGCGDKIKTELPMKNIKSMMVNGFGDVYLLTDTGLRYYALSGDKEVDYIYSSDEIADARFEWSDSGQDVTYLDLAIDRLLPAGEDGVTMVGRYLTNTAGRSRELFVIQDAADLNYTAGYFHETDKDDTLNTPVLNGVAVTSQGLYFKLNRHLTDSRSYDGGVSFSFYGDSTPFTVPDFATGAVEKDGKVYFITESKTQAQINCDGKVIKTFDRAALADAFVSGNDIYAFYKDGSVKICSTDGGETDFIQIKTTVNDVNDAFIWDGKVYWFDGEGVKTSK